MITRERYVGNNMTKKEFDSWIRRNTKLMSDDNGYLYGVSLKEFNVDYNLLSVKNKKQAIKKLINHKTLYKRYTGEYYTSMYVSDWENTEIYDMNLKHPKTGFMVGYKYKKFH